MDSAEIRYAGASDLPYLIGANRLVTETVLKKKVEDGEVIVYLAGDVHLGMMSFGLAWDMFPFLNLIIVEEHARGKGIGRRLMEFWEREMKNAGYKLVMTSTDVDQDAQHFYRNLGYRDSGGILFPKELFPESAMELVLIKILK
jgi:GNAT superfamily N-acetyltransferase